jgi:ubiquinone biosynthesis protein UbiJ
MSAAALIAGAGGLVSSILPKDAPDVDAAQQFINKMASETTPEGLAKNSPLLAESGDLSEGPVSAKENATPGGELKPSIPIGQLRGSPTPIFAEGYQPPPFDEMTQEMATKTANVTADYKDFAQAAIDYAQNQHDINDLSAKIADNNTTLTAMKESGTLLPDQYTAKLAADTAAMEKALAALKSSDPDLAQGLNEATDKFSTSMKSYAGYLKANGFMADDSGLDEAIKTLPRNSPEMIRTTINQLMNADNTQIIASKNLQSEAPQNVTNLVLIVTPPVFSDFTNEMLFRLGITGESADRLLKFTDPNDFGLLSFLSELEDANNSASALLLSYVTGDTMARQSVLKVARGEAKFTQTLTKQEMVKAEKTSDEIFSYNDPAELKQVLALTMRIIQVATSQVKVNGKTLPAHRFLNC